MDFKNDTFIRALRRQDVPHVPVWLMRQAGRYLPEYRQTRERAGSFLALAKTPELACEVTLQPLKRFALDAAILFSDILTIPDAFGLGLSFVDGEGPRFARRIESAESVRQLPNVDVAESLSYVADAVTLIKRELHRSVPLIGFSGAPWTLMCYMIEGGGSAGYARAKQFLLRESAASHQLLSKLANAVSDYLIMQARAGADVLMLFDSWAGLLAPVEFENFCLRYLQQIVQSIKADASAAALPLIVFAKGANAHLEALAGLGCEALGLDWQLRISEARQRCGPRVALQGNLDPSILYASPADIRHQVALLLDDAGPDAGHIFNLGHGMNPDMDPEHAAVLIDAVHAYSKAQRAGTARGDAYAMARALHA
jgi:uroporphyrinogen decarboxylase